MRLVKLGAITSTNDFLKEMAGGPGVENYTVVTAESQSAGRGQMGAKWEAEPGKNLIMSMLISDVHFAPGQIFNLNVIVANAVAYVLTHYNIPRLTVKWPNDIMSGSKKLGGILIENTFKSGGGMQSIIGIGINVAQQKFNGLAKADSILNILGIAPDIDTMALQIGNEIKSRIARNDTALERSEYHRSLFKLGTPAMFESDGKKFLGKIIKVETDGRLSIAHENGTITSFAIREIAMLY